MDDQMAIQEVAALLAVELLIHLYSRLEMPRHEARRRIALTQRASEAAGVWFDLRWPP